MKCLRWRSNRNRVYLLLTLVALFLISKKIAQEPERVDEEDEVLEQVDVQEDQKKEECPPPGAIESKCFADNGKPMRCWKDEEDVYFPVSYLKKRFDLSGKVGKDGSTFELYTSYAKMRSPDGKYDPLGSFGHFSTYSVETRDRVRCISAKTEKMLNFPFQMKEDDLLVLINYVFSDSNGKCVWQEEERNSDDQVIQIKPKKDGQVSYSYSYEGNAPQGELSTVTRDILVDVARALSSGENRKKDDNVVLHPGDIRLVSLGFRGQVTVKQRVVQRKEQHEHAFRASADWLAKSQDSQGGWAVPVERSIAERKLVLPPGWHSAMAQGHGISVLTRAYHQFSDKKYLDSAISALEIFKKNASEGGVRASFFGTIWYEEYPTTPGSFVLNGFLYSLIGLYDLSQLDVSTESEDVRSKVKEAQELYQLGVKSLKQLLPLYDTGSGTIYDLRHVALGTAPNLARWDYHAVHVYLLKWIAGIEKDDLLAKTADRWIGYAYGKRAKHNW
uniref:Heparosan-N-sulfate-glucuronate 5-epimerase n=1 Tax=Caenorhabditis japonica TaxID=281687 RepID=A0A8R1DN43_CAEJA